MKLPIRPPITPMLALLGDTLPEGDYLYEPKWDGFRAVVFRDGDEIVIQSRHQRSLNRFFPDLVEGLKRQLPIRAVVDGEIVIAGERGLDFDALQLRLHPAASRVAQLAAERPAQLVVFDVLALGKSDLRSLPLRRRRAMLEKTLSRAEPPVHLTPATHDAVTAQDWFRRFEGAGLDGVVAKSLDLSYIAGERVMIKIKHRRTADCVVGGFRFGRDGKGVASLLLGLYDRGGRLHFTGAASGFSSEQRADLGARLRPYRDAREHPWRDQSIEALHGTPLAPSRWAGDRDLAWEAVRPELVAEVAYDHLQGERFRHVTRFVRWRSDRTPESCNYDQLEVAPPAELAALFGRRAA